MAATRRKKSAYHHGNLGPALLDAALQLLERHGHEALSLREVARLAGPFGMRVSAIRKRADAPAPEGVDEVLPPERLPELLANSDVVVLSAPLTRETRGLIGAREVAQMKRGALLVNIGRGALVDQDAVCDLLDGGKLSGAVLDVFTPEPIQPGHRLWTTQNLIISPHTAADDPNTYNARSLDLFFDNLRAWREGRPMPNLFDPTRGY